MLPLRHFGNLDDNVQINIEQARQNFERRAFTRNTRRKLLHFTAALIKLGIWKRLIESGLSGRDLMISTITGSTGFIIS